MTDTVKTNPEGGTDFEGLQNFIINVDTEGFEPKQEEEVQINLGDEKDDQEKSSEEQIKDSELKEGETPPTKEIVEDTPKVDQKDSYYGNLAQKFITKGKWQDAEIETEKGTFKLSELETIDEETFFAIEESQNKFNEDEIKTNYIKKGDFDENKLRIIEILREGGDITEIFSSPEDIKRPFEGVDLEDKRVQQNIFYNYLTKVTKLNGEDANVILVNHDKRGELGEKVKEIVQGYQVEHDNKLTSKLESIKLEKAERAKKDKEFGSTLEDIYKNYNIDTKLAKRFSSLGTKRTEDGDFELDSIYSEKMEKPEEAADLIFFLTDKEGYLKSKMADSRIGTQKENLRKINILKDKQRKDDKSPTHVDDGRSDFIISVNQ